MDFLFSIRLNIKFFFILMGSFQFSEKYFLVQIIYSLVDEDGVFVGVIYVFCQDIGI